ncbi:hypothetical protein TSMEX_006536 [Taenia solium]|eukprot:TsM_000034000 transcript=TsM_000034000 gene=TsM_000034000
METIFKLDEKFEEVTPDSREVTSLFTLEGGTIKVDELVCVRNYVKAA